MAREERVDLELAQLTERADLRVEPAVVNVLKEDLAAVEDYVAGEQAPAAAVLEQERDVPVRVARCVERAERQVADCDLIPVGELDIDVAGFEHVAGRVGA